jgi:hypothetical protein
LSRANIASILFIGKLICYQPSAFLCCELIAEC